jgi:uncharacterized cupredoxin-like copper-binding protein
MRALLVTITASLLLLAACGGQTTSNNPGPGSNNGPVAVTLTDTGVAIGQTTVNAGAVTFSVKNIGTINHELVVVKTDVAADKIQADPAAPGKMSEDGSLGESGDMEAGTAKDFILTLTPGKYVLMCNQPGHYMIGMHIAFEVK